MSLVALLFLLPCICAAPYLPFDYEFPASRSTPSLDSPIYYIRLPPTPYMYVPGLGYVSRPPPPPVPPEISPFLPLPIDFVANGKPNTIYQWASEQAPPPAPPKKKKKPTTSQIHHLEGQFLFNGKPDGVTILRDSYNALYGDALQNFYP